MINNIHRLFFKAFSNQTRLGIINLLKNKPLTVSEICKKLKLEQSRISHNLKCLEYCGFVHSKQKGKWKRYSLDKETILPIIKLFDKHVKKYKRRLQQCRELSQK